MAEHYAKLFHAHVLNPGFPCTLGKSSYRNRAFRFSHYQTMDPSDLDGLCHDLAHFVSERGSIAPAGKGIYETYAASFFAPAPTTEQEYEKSLWRVLQYLHDADSSPWDSGTSSDPADPTFSFSFAGRSFFVVGMNPVSSRISRRFLLPTLVFNSHDQFDDLRARGAFNKAQAAIRAADIRLQGSINPSLAQYGSDSEVKQYSGRLVEPHWKCPFRP